MPVHENKPGQKSGEATRPAPQGDNPADRHDSPGVTPEPLKSGAPEPTPPAPGVDPDSVLRAAKHAFAAADPSGDEHAKSQVEKAGKARGLIAERNVSRDPARVEAIDAELKSLGFEAPLPTTEVQRSGPVGRRAPGKTTA